MKTNDKTTPHYWQDGCRYLSERDKTIAAIIHNYKGEVLTSKGEAFYTLARAIVSQQISTKAANTIWERFSVLCNGTPYPAIILGLEDEQMRGAGLSASKVKYMRALADEFARGKLSHNLLAQMEDNEIRSSLLKLPGIGSWTVEMFLIFCLLRPDIFPIKDLGIRKAVSIHYGEKASIEYLSELWQPYRTIATWYLWRSLEPKTG
jgi:DNA-3-methyladenine glycosylase II